MLSYTDLKSGVVVVIDGQPYEVQSADFLRMQQRKAVVQTKIKNLITGKVLDRNFQPSDSFEEADVEKKSAMFLYSHRDEYWFHEAGNPKARFKLDKEIIGDEVLFLRPNTEVAAFLFNGNIINIEAPIKVDLKVTESPPAVKGNTAQGGTKPVLLETGARINAPLFIEEGDVVRVNTETGEYVERISKAN